jgi:DNA modification methylase
MPVVVRHGDCLDVMRTMPDASVHAIVTDPPYGLGFMGKEWDSGKSFVERKPDKRNTFDHVGGNHNPTSSADAARTRGVEGRRYGEWCEVWAAECLRVLRPGGYLLAFGGSRTFHRLACAVEDGGFEIRDSIAWLYGSGFPKSHNVGREVTGFEGWGTALKPAFEPVVVARKPLAGTVAGNVQEWGTGALNIDACRVGSTVETWPATRRHTSGNAYVGLGGTQYASQTMSTGEAPAGRWPANVVLDGSQADALDQQSGTLTSGGGDRGSTARRGGIMGVDSDASRPTPYAREADSGGASRFFPTFRYQAKAPTAERPTYTTPDGRKISHPTVKPLGLMRWLVKLVTPPGGVVLDPFAGSGATVEACLIEGFDCVAIERDPESLPLIQIRIDRQAGTLPFEDVG